MKQSDVVVLSASRKFWPELEDLVGDLRLRFISTSKEEIRIREIVLAAYYAQRHQMSLGRALLAARVQLSGAGIFLGIDNRRDAFDILRRTHPNMNQVIIAHGPIRRESLEKSHGYLSESHDRRTLIVWGSQDRETIETVYGQKVKCVVAGSVRNAYHIMTKHAFPAEPSTELLLVSNYSPKHETNTEFQPARARVLALLKSHLAQYCREHGLGIRIALRPEVNANSYSGQWEEEKRHYQEIFSGLNPQFTNPQLRFSTYRASDAANVTIGLPAGALTESFGRGNKVLMIGQAFGSNAVFGFPIDGLWLLSEPSYAEFRQRLSELRQMNVGEYQKTTADSRARILMHATSSETLNVIQKVVAKQLEPEALVN